VTDAEAKAFAIDGRAEFRVWWVPQVPMEAFYHPVPDLKTGKLLDCALGRYDLFQFEQGVKPDYANAGGVEWRHPEVTAGEWESIEDDEAEYLGLFSAPDDAAEPRSSEAATPVQADPGSTQ
jgi:hypothetical protein